MSQLTLTRTPILFVGIVYIGPVWISVSARFLAGIRYRPPPVRFHFRLILTVDL